MSKPFSDAYVQHRRMGPFTGHIDAWAEVGRYFHQIYAGLIGHLLTQMQEPLLKLGYEAGRETSLQILERSAPDVYVWQNDEPTQHVVEWDYAGAAEAVLAQPGVSIQSETPELDAIFVRDFEAGQLVAVVEIISPTNKVDLADIAEYRRRREAAIRHGVNVMEIDPTRSIKRLLQDVLVKTYAYHIAIYLPHKTPRIIGIDFGEPLPRVAMPLRGEVVPMELQMAYDFAYQQASIAGHIYSEDHYDEAALPFPSLITNTQRLDAMKTVLKWIEQLEQLKTAVL